LVYGDFEFQLELPFEPQIEERLYRICQSEPPESAERNRSDIARRIADLVTALLEGEALPPTAKQVKYAVAIAKELSLELPPQVLQYRDAMAVFLGTHAPEYRRRRAEERQPLGSHPR
jgi:hypothetical protein